MIFSLSTSNILSFLERFILVHTGMFFVFRGPIRSEGWCRAPSELPACIHHICRIIRQWYILVNHTTVIREIRFLLTITRADSTSSGFPMSSLICGTKTTIAPRQKNTFGSITAQSNDRFWDLTPSALIQNLKRTHAELTVWPWRCHLS